MKPLNNDNPSCNPISSNCVIWQGPDIPCIKLCKGDTVTDVVYKMATELCDILKQIDVSTYDLSCLNLTECAPKDFHALIQLLIDKICELNECCNDTTDPGTRDLGCPDGCIVEICPQFQYTDAFGNTVTTMTLKDYVIAIGNKVCSLIQQINTINLTLQNHETRITYIEENCCDQSTPNLPILTTTCITDPVANLGLVDFVQTLEAAFCELRNITGTATELLVSINKQCPGLDTENQLSGPPGATMASLPGWVPSSEYNTVADSLTNMWLTICDMRAAIRFIQQNCCPGTCEDFSVAISATFTNPEIRLYVTGSIPVGYTSCNPVGTLFTITDGNGNSITQLVNVPFILNNGVGFPINITSTPLNPASNFTITGTICVTNPADGSQCSSTVTYVIQNQALCPLLETSPSTNSINYTLSVLAPATYKVELVSSCGSPTALQTNIHVVGVLGPVSGVFGGLTSGTSYIIRVTVQNYSGAVLLNQTVCPCVSVITEPGACIPPTLSEIEPYIVIPPLP